MFLLSLAKLARASRSLRVFDQATVYPPSEIHDFKEPNKKVEVYSKPFKLLRDVNIQSSVKRKEGLAATPSPIFTGNLEYQVCDEGRREGKP